MIRLKASLSRLLVWVVLALSTAIVFAGCSVLPQKKAGLQVLTTDVPSSIFVDGQYMDKTPYIGKEFKPGTYTVKIEPDNPKLVPHETTVTLEPGLLTVITWKPGEKPETSGGVIYELEKLSSNKETEISVVSLPDGAIVSLDDQQKEFTPLAVPAIDPGAHEIAVSLPSYQSQKHTINAVAGHRLNITIKLAKETVQEPQPSAPVSNPEILSDAIIATKSGTVAGAVAQPSATPATAPVRQPVASVPTNTSSVIRIESTQFFVDGKEVLKVRSEPGATGTELGYAPVGSTYPYLEETKNGWFKIQFNNAPGWVTGQFSKKEP